MKDTEYYLKLSLQKLKDVLPEDPNLMLIRYLSKRLWHSMSYDNSKRAYLLFAWPEAEGAERIILLVYDDDSIIADMSALHAPADALMRSRELYDLCSEESDWMYLEHYIFCRWGFGEYPYPYCEEENKSAQPFAGEALLLSNAYVTKAYRGQGIFSMMESLMREAALRNSTGRQDLYCVFSQDPDVACYGPDSQDEPYYYNYENDEPARLLNAQIAAHLGYENIRLNEDDPSENKDGTKICFCIKKENDWIVETDALS
ncbi:MAG: hypothetical protein K6A40_13195 [Solobacterium sp.]|nr:hypothetical protein [Solobacterium sp.]